MPMMAMGTMAMQQAIALLQMILETDRRPAPSLVFAKMCKGNIEYCSPRVHSFLL
jgi:predicted transglutaminase-like cysteine proteinase